MPDFLLALETLNGKSTGHTGYETAQLKKKRFADQRGLEDTKEKVESRIAAPGKSRASLRRKKILKAKGIQRQPTVEFRERLERFYKKHAPSKLTEMEPLLLKFAGDEDTLFEMLVLKYGEEPRMKIAVVDVDGSKADKLLKQYAFLQRKLQKGEASGDTKAALAKKMAKGADGQKIQSDRHVVDNESGEMDDLDALNDANVDLFLKQAASAR